MWEKKEKDIENRIRQNIIKKVPVIYTCQKYFQEFSLNLCISNTLTLQFQQKEKKDQLSQDPAALSALIFLSVLHVFSCDCINITITLRHHYQESSFNKEKASNEFSV